MKKIVTILLALVSMVSLHAQTPFGEEDESDPFVKYPPKDLRFKSTDSFHDLIERYEHILVQKNFAEFRNTRFCMDGVETSFNYFMLCGYGVAWQRPHGICSYSAPLDGSPSELCPDPRYPPSKKFKFIQVTYNALGYVYGDKVYKKGELQSLITDLVLGRFYCHDSLPYSYHLIVVDNPTLKECWYFIAILHLFAENRIIYSYAIPSKKTQGFQEKNALDAPLNTK